MDRSDSGKIHYLNDKTDSNLFYRLGSEFYRYRSCQLLQILIQSKQHMELASSFSLLRDSSYVYILYLHERQYSLRANGVKRRSGRKPGERVINSALALTYIQIMNTVA